MISYWWCIMKYAYRLMLPFKNMLVCKHPHINSDNYLPAFFPPSLLLFFFWYNFGLFIFLKKHPLNKSKTRRWKMKQLNCCFCTVHLMSKSLLKKDGLPWFYAVLPPPPLSCSTFGWKGSVLMVLNKSCQEQYLYNASL